MICEFFDDNSCNLLGCITDCNGNKSSCPKKKEIKKMGYMDYFTGKIVIKPEVSDMDIGLDLTKDEWIK